MGKTYRIAVIPGDGIGKETTPEGLRVLDAAATRFGFSLKLDQYDWSCETWKQTGKMMPDDGMARLAESDSIFLGAVGWPGVPDHVSLWGLLIPIRRGFDQYANVRPCKLMPGAVTPLAESLASRSALCAGQRNAISIWPARSRSTSSPRDGCRAGGRTLRMMSLDDQTAAASAAIDAPAA